MEINWSLFEQYNLIDSRKRTEVFNDLKITCLNPEIKNILAKSHFVIPQKTRFSCQQCGECCKYARKVATLTYEPCTFLTQDNKCAKHANRYLVCKWFPFFVYDDPNYGPLLTIKPYCSGYGKGELVDYYKTVNRIKNLEDTADSKNDGAVVIHEVLYLPEKKEWVFPSRVNIDKLLQYINETTGKSNENQEKLYLTELKYAQQFTGGLLGGLMEPQLTVNEDGFVTDVNDSFLRFSENTSEKVLKSKFYDLFVDNQKISQEVALCFSSGRLNAIPERIKLPNGRTKNVLVNAVTYRSREDGLIHGLLVCFSEVSDSVFSEINHSKNYARGLIEASLDLLVFLDRDGTISDVNQACCNMLNMDRESIIGTKFIDYFDNPQFAEKGIELTYNNGFVKNYVLKLNNTSEGVIPVSFNASLYKDEDGIVKGIFASARDIRETYNLINSLEKAKNYARSLIEASIDLMVTISKEGKIMDVNNAASEITGVERDVLIGSDFCIYFEDKEKAKQGIELTYSKGKVNEFELILINSKKERVKVSFNASLYKEIDGSIAGIFASARVACC